MQKSEFPKLHHYVGFWQIGSQITMYTVCTLHMYVHTYVRTQEYIYMYTYI